MKSGLVVQESVSLMPRNTLRVEVMARYYTNVTSVEQLRQALAWADERGLETLILGGGSNLVFADDVDALVIHMAIAGCHWANAANGEATLVLGAGECWHEAVLYAAAAGYRGIENLALIPGTAGAAPIQNIGAYGVELSDTLVSVTALDSESQDIVKLSNEACEFAYRDSLFKRQPGRYIILEIAMQLSRTRSLALGYGDLQQYFSGREPARALTPADVAQGVMAIRRRKLPDPAQLPNVGSFFKNAIVPQDTWEQLRADHPDMVAYPADHSVKLAAAWLIDQCGWKGYREDKVGVHNRQALVLINHNGGTGADILALARRIRDDVQARFGVELEMEPRVVPAGLGL
ncbi:UDP-N-acetylmuramate dehydrogenase [Marinobacter sp. SS21]|uniref:UDP-N-acetylmuramate dehydrogenase n=1 Tax=Marinobacter sp. SS21 TaxID=2979460 RepID=UPI002331165A|nr:UDP-N-acetylmuramate dehydrogenase [Marinobacter sp. SS21]MDC0662005.1 UDP-N-acetylmuramate dehydrogenase [Marinobacter sp. SS21]